jgi:capsular polysaccharide biosynthesis protein
MWESFALGRSEVHLRDYIAVIRRHDFVVIISFLLIFGTALIVSLYMPRVYESTATIEVEQSSSPTGLSGLMQNVISRGVDQVSMETLCKRFVSNSVLNETIRNIKRNSPGKNNDLTPEFLTPKIIAKTVPDTKMIEVKVRLMKDEGGSERASKIANELVRVMQNQRGKRTDADIIRRQDFINDKIRYFESQITDSDQNIRNFLKDKGGNITWSAYADYLLNRI